MCSALNVSLSQVSDRAQPDELVLQQHPDAAHHGRNQVGVAAQRLDVQRVAARRDQ